MTCKVLFTASTVLALSTSMALAQQSAVLPDITVTNDHARHTDAPQAPLNGGVFVGEKLADKQASTPDVAGLLADIPGVSVQQAGGVSGLPVVRGLADDRNKILLGGVDITSACANHMNPTLSYIDTVFVGRAEVLTGAIPVSKGGDSIGGTILVNPSEPVFAGRKASAPAGKPQRGKLPVLAQDDPALIFTGSVSAFYRSTDRGTKIAGNATVATKNFSLNYAGAWARGDDYHAGNGAKVRSTNYNSQNHAATLAYQNDGQLITLRGTYQNIPYQGFANQRMDMLGNEAATINLGYKGNFGWGVVDANAYWQRTKHYMNFLADKGGSTPTSGMPMYTDGKDFGYAVKADIALSAQDKLRIGNEFHGQRLNDWWPPAGMMMMMCCNTFWNINGGSRDRLGTFAEWERKWSKEWTTTLGVRNDTIWMNTGNVQGYNNMAMMYGADANAFNALRHAKTDMNFDMSAIARYEPSATNHYEGGYTRKTRSPNLYERFAWSSNTMASSMVNWFGDANGYIGNINLKPEVAHTLSFTAAWHDSSRDVWELKISPYYSRVNGFIDADLVRANGANFNILKFANHDAQLYGVDISGRVRLLDSPDYGRLALTGVVGYVHGKNLDTGDKLYHMMPFNGKVALEHKLGLYGGSWTNALELQAVGAKTAVSAVRKEPTTPSYALLNMRTSYEWKNIRFDLGVENLFDKHYYLPLGGVDFADFRAGGSVGRIGALPGTGRSIYAGMTTKF